MGYTNVSDARGSLCMPSSDTGGNACGARYAEDASTTSHRAMPGHDAKGLQRQSKALTRLKPWSRCGQFLLGTVGTAKPVQSL
jgi:hypothetical protein